MDLKGKTAAQLEELRLAKAKELQDIFEKHSVQRDGALTFDLTSEQLQEVKNRNKELDEIGVARDDAREIERIAASAKSAQADYDRPRRPQFPGSGEPVKPAAEQKSIGQQFVESPEFKAWQDAGKPAESKPVQVGMDLKAVMTTTAGWAPQAVRAPRFVDIATTPIDLLDLIPMGTTNQNAYVYMEETTYTNTAAETAEGAAKPEATLVLTQRTSPVRKIAVTLPVTDEQLEDVPGIQTYIESRLVNMVRQRLNTQILVGDGIAPNLLGLINVPGIQTQAKGADPTPDAVFKAMTLVETVGQANPSAVVLNPADWQDIRLLRTVDGLYIWGSPAEAGPERIWGLPVVKAQGLTAGTGVTGDFRNYALLLERSPMSVAIGYVNDDFRRNQRTIRAEIRVAIVFFRPTAFATITGI